MIGFLLLSLYYGFGYADGGQCIWRGLCNTTSDETALYCNYSGPPISISDSSSLKKLLEVCPEYANSKNPSLSLPVCCSPDQIDVFYTSLQLAKMFLGGYVSNHYIFFFSCPSCFANFRRLFCEMTCNPTQSNFLSAVNVRSDKAIKLVNYKLTRQFGEGFFDSCAVSSAFKHTCY